MTREFTQLKVKLAGGAQIATVMRTSTASALFLQAILITNQWLTIIHIVHQPLY